MVCVHLLAFSPADVEAQGRMLASCPTRLRYLVGRDQCQCAVETHAMEQKVHYGTGNFHGETALVFLLWCDLALTGVLELRWSPSPGFRVSS